MKPMRNTLAGLAAVACFAGALAFSPAQDKDRKPLPPGVKPEPTPAALAFDQMKALAGTWEGNINGDAKEKTTVSYRVIANGSAVVETLFGGTPVEMETIFHMDGARLLATHYCAGGNQPRLNAIKIEPKMLTFEMIDATNLPDKKLPHMGALRIEFVDGDHIKTNWSSFADGKVGETAVFDLTRAKAQDTAKPEAAKPGTAK